MDSQILNQAIDAAITALFNEDVIPPVPVELDEYLHRHVLLPVSPPQVPPSPIPEVVSKLVIPVTCEPNGLY
jgi:hypothetical protein